MNNKTQTAVEWLQDKWGNCKEWSWEEIKQWFEQAKEIENHEKNNLPIHIHGGIEKTWVYIEDGIVHVKPNPKINEQQ